VALGYEFNPDRGKGLTQFPHAGSNVEAADAFHGGHANVAARFACDTADVFSDGDRTTFDRFGVDEQFLARVGQHEPVWAAIKQLAVQAALKLCHAPADRGVVGPKLASGRNQSSLPRELKEKCEITPIEAWQAHLFHNADSRCPGLFSFPPLYLTRQ
jgi:hypothetical protein